MAASESAPSSSPITRLFWSALSASWALLRPSLPYILPLLVCLSLIPLILFFSASAGWIIWRSAAVSWQTPLYLIYGDGLPPYAQATLPTLVAQQRYDFSLELQVPNVDANYALGNFMASLTLSTRANETLVSIRRPAIVVPPRVAFYASPPAMITVHVPLLASHATGASHVIANVEVGRRDHWKSLGSEGRELSVVAASLRGVVVHHGIRGLVTRMPLLSALVSFFVFLTILSLIVGACVLPLLFRRVAAAEHPLELAPAKVDPLLAISSDSSDDSDSSEEKLALPRRTSRPASRTTIKTEEARTTILPSESQADPLLRRRRRSKLVDPASSDSDS